jgi:hypothetical protein
MEDLGKPTHTLVLCRMLKPLPSRNQCTDWFTHMEGSHSGTTTTEALSHFGHFFSRNLKALHGGRFGKFRVWGPLHTRDWEHVMSTLQAFSLVENAKLVQIRFTLCLGDLCLGDQRSMWMHDGCKVYVDSYMASIGHVSWSLGLFSKTTSWRLAQHKTKRPWHSERSQPLVYSILSCARTCVNRNSLK